MRKIHSRFPGRQELLPVNQAPWIPRRLSPRLSFIEDRRRVLSRLSRTSGFSRAAPTPIRSSRSKNTKGDLKSLLWQWGIWKSLQASASSNSMENPVSNRTAFWRVKNGYSPASAMNRGIFMQGKYGLPSAVPRIRRREALCSSSNVYNVSRH